MLEELCRAISASPSADTAVFWEELLGGPLTSVLQSYAEPGVLSAQACDILATMSPQDMGAIKVELQFVMSVCLYDCLFVCLSMCRALTGCLH